MIAPMKTKKRRGVMTGDWIFVATILVLGAITGFVVSRSAELADDDAPRPVAVSVEKSAPQK